MQVYYLPAGLALIEHYGSSVDETCPILEMKRRNRHIAEQLNLHFFWLNVHIRSCRLATANLFENRFEGPLKFRAPVCALRKCTRIKNGCMVIKRCTECFPIKVIKGVNEPGKRLSDLQFRTDRLSLSERGHNQQTQNDGKACNHESRV